VERASTHRRILLTLRGVGMAYLPSIPWIFIGLNFGDGPNFLAFPLGTIHLIAILGLQATGLDPSPVAAVLGYATLPLLIWFAWRYQSIRAHLILLAVSASFSLLIVFLLMSVPT